MLGIYNIVLEIYILIIFFLMETQKHWFAPKTYGYGVMPVTWQGWLFTTKLLFWILLIGFVDGIMDWNGGNIQANELATLDQWLRFAVDTAFILGIWFLYAASKTKGELKWRWGSSL